MCGIGLHSSAEEWLRDGTVHTIQHQGDHECQSGLHRPFFFWSPATLLLQKPGLSHLLIHTCRGDHRKAGVPSSLMPPAVGSRT